MVSIPKKKIVNGSKINQKDTPEINDRYHLIETTSDLRGSKGRGVEEEVVQGWKWNEEGVGGGYCKGEEDVMLLGILKSIGTRRDEFMCNQQRVKRKNVRVI